MGRRERAMTKPLRNSHDVDIFRLPDMVNAPAEGAGSRGPVVPTDGCF